MKRSYPFETNDQDMDIERDKKRPRHKYQIKMVSNIVDNREIYEKIFQLESRILRLETLLKNTYQSIYNFCQVKNEEEQWNFYIS
jgi:hypothetical protein